MTTKSVHLILPSNSSFEYPVSFTSPVLAIAIVVSSSIIAVSVPVFSNTLRYLASDACSFSSARFLSVMSLTIPRKPIGSPFEPILREMEAPINLLPPSFFIISQSKVFVGFPVEYTLLNALKIFLAFFLSMYCLLFIPIRSSLGYPRISHIGSLKKVKLPAMSTSK